MFGLLRSVFYAFGLCMVFIAYNMNPETARLQDFLELLHAPLFWQLHLVVTGVLYCFHLVGVLPRYTSALAVARPISGTSKQYHSLTSLTSVSRSAKKPLSGL